MWGIGQIVFLWNKRKWQKRGSSKQVAIQWKEVASLHCWMSLAIKEEEGEMSEMSEMSDSIKWEEVANEWNKFCHQTRGSSKGVKWVLPSNKRKQQRSCLEVNLTVFYFVDDQFWFPQFCNCLDLFIWIPWRFIWHLDCRVVIFLQRHSVPDSNYPRQRVLVALLKLKQHMHCNNFGSLPFS